MNNTPTTPETTVAQPAPVQAEQNLITVPEWTEPADAVPAEPLPQFENPQQPVAQPESATENPVESKAGEEVDNLVLPKLQVIDPEGPAGNKTIDYNPKLGGLYGQEIATVTPATPVTPEAAAPQQQSSHGWLSKLFKH